MMLAIGNNSIEDFEDYQLMVIEGKQLSKRLTKGDVITVYGRYTDVNNFDIDGKSHIFPTIKSINLIQLGSNEDTNYRFNLDTAKTVAEYIFGKDIKISSPVKGEDYDYESSYTSTYRYCVDFVSERNKCLTGNNNVYSYYSLTDSDVVITDEWVNKVESFVHDNLKVTKEEFANDVKNYDSYSYDDLKQRALVYYDRMK